MGFAGTYCDIGLRWEELEFGPWRTVPHVEVATDADAETDANAEQHDADAE